MVSGYDVIVMNNGVKDDRKDDWDDSFQLFGADAQDLANCGVLSVRLDRQAGGV